MYKVDVYLRVRRAVMVEGMSIREAARVFGLHRDTVRKMLAYSVPPGYRRQTPPRRPKLEPFTRVIDRILDDDLRRPRKQRHTAKRIFERLRDEYGFDGQYTIIKDYVREHRRQTKEMFVPLSHAPGHAQCDFGEALVVMGGIERKAHCFVIDLPHSEGVQALDRGEPGGPVPPLHHALMAVDELQLGQPEQVLGMVHTLGGALGCHLPVFPEKAGQLQFLQVMFQQQRRPVVHAALPDSKVM